MRLGNQTVDGLAPSIARPGYDRARVTAGIVHLGLGAFHRAHQAAYTDAVLGEDPGWGIVGASLRSADTVQALAPQDGLYTLAARGPDGDALRVIGALVGLIGPGDLAGKLLPALCDPRVRVVTMTVTEKGYSHDPSTGDLDPAHPAIAADLARPEEPSSVPGLLVEALHRRRDAGIAPFAAVSCDNLAANGHTLHRVLCQYAGLRDRDLAAYVEGEVTCPSTMVDRITPAATADDRTAISRALGLDDAAPVVAEPFSQWVVEDSFPAGRPPWEAAGAELVADVAPYEAMKLRLLNGAHSALAYLGYLSGCETVADAMAEPGLAAFADALMGDAASTLTMPGGADVAAYRRQLLQRFRNPALRHRTWQIAMDGSQKLPQRLLAPVSARLANGAPIGRHALAVAAWMRYVAGADEAGRPIDVRDPLAGSLRSACEQAGPESRAQVGALLNVRAVFGNELAADQRFVSAVVAAHKMLVCRGARRAAANYAAD